MTSPGSPSPESENVWKRKFEVLEAQYAISKDIGPKEKRCISFLVFIDIQL
jgi:hypothetical protein